MKKPFLIILFVLLYSATNAKDQPKVITNNVLIGRNLVSNSDIYAQEYLFTDRIEYWQLDDSAKSVIVRLRAMLKNELELSKNGSLLCYDLKDKDLRWKNSIDYDITSVDQYNDILIRTNNYKSNCINNETGKNLWESSTTLYYVSSKQNIGIGFKYSTSGFTNTLQGIDLRTGKVLWDNKVSREFGIREIVALNDSVVIIAADNLNTVNINTGKGWEYSTNTAKKDRSGTVIANILNVSISLLFNVDIKLERGYELYTDLTSNLLNDATGIYTADRKSISKIDARGKKVWKTRLPTNLVGNSTLFVKGDNVYMVNNGFIFHNGKLINHGRPFIAAFSIKSGKKIFINTIDYKGLQVNSFDIQKDTITFLTKNQIFKYSLINGSVINEQYIKPEKLGDLKHFADNNIYLRNDSSFEKLNLLESKNTVVFTNNNQLVILNTDLTITKIIPIDQIYFCYLDKNNIKFLENGNYTYLINSHGKLVAELDISGNVQLSGNKLYEVQQNDMIEIDIEEIINSLNH